MHGVSALISPAPQALMPSTSRAARRPTDVDLPSPSNLTFKVASEPWEFDQIHRLNYKTFVEEIPQHQANPDGVLVDRFHATNIYFIALAERQVVGMVSCHFDRPFSLDQKVENLQGYLPNEAKNVCEVRLLATDKEHRGGRVFFGLIATLVQYLVDEGCDLALISGTTRQLKLYRHMGFEPFGPLVGTAGAMYQPMFLRREKFKEIIRPLLPAIQSDDGFGAVSFLPGPVDVTPQVRRAFASAPVSHRSDQFLEDVRRTKDSLCKLVNARHVQILTGSGTLANDVVAAQISLIDGRGVILSNGEFGDRLLDHAGRIGLDFTPHAKPWGEVFALAEIEQQIAADPTIKWLWAVHCETSTGVLNDLSGLKSLARRHNLKLCLDCISSIGTVPVDLADIHLASGISGKGLRGYPGLSLVFHNDQIAPAEGRLPRYLDLGFYAAKSGVPFTLCSNLLYALKTAVEQLDPATRFHAITQQSAYIRGRLEEMTLPMIATEAHSSPAIITIPLPREISATKIGDRLADAGFYLSCKSDYLLERNWIQVCLMGQYTRETIDQMLATLGRCTSRAPRSLRR
jgi:aspartate aminotransferase-like enzyme/GNAT superfamily N-acetyltransferase